jgi:putative SOS response-associated peptidase YedK
MAGEVNMCGRFVLNSTAEDVAATFDLGEVLELRSRFNIAPTQEILVVRASEDGSRHGSLQRWGLIPAWAKDRAIGSRMINARAETVAEKPAFRAALRKRRCIVPASGFYEWRGKAGAKTPYYFKSRSNAVLAVAGLWESWKDPEGVAVESCTLITTEANQAVRETHDRMPVLLEARDFSLWLNPGEQTSERVLPLLVPCPSDWLESYAVSPHVNRVSNDDPSCTEPA